ncbi:hypothetical protein CEXT_785331 [Caerostris extrusa]|uniref:Uncharacterized protein n=1 Tax=Caerostris extrusa TaxID=172846 RepID=A0AAV4NTN8_CAEEX|nr:hypothetical protein CEXT_785331 [Caerostris extrusa]
MGKAGFCLITVEGVELVRRNNIEFPTHVVGLFPVPEKVMSCLMTSFYHDRFRFNLMLTDFNSCNIL